MSYEDTRVPLLLFSGGADSTLRLMQLLKEGAVDVLYCKSQQHPAKVEMELRARKKIIARLEKDSLYRVSRDHVVDLATMRVNPFHKFQQVMPWLMAALTTFDPMRHSHVELAYLLGDEIMIHRHEVMKSWHYLTQVLFHDPVELRLPFLHTSKARVYQNLPAELTELIWVCEIPVRPRGRRLFNACGTCMACKTRRYHLAMIEESEQTPVPPIAPTVKKTRKRASK